MLGLFLFCLISVLMCIVGVWLLGGASVSAGYEWHKIVGGFCLFVLGAIATVGGPFQYMESVSEVIRYESMRETVKIARGNKDMSVYELAALQAKIVEANASIATMKYYANIPVFGPVYCAKSKTIKTLE